MRAGLRSRRTAHTVVCKSIKGTVWSLRKVVNQRKRQPADDDANAPPSALATLEEEAIPARMTLGALSVEGGTTSSKRKAGATSGGAAEQEADYGRESILDIARDRTGWLVAFCVGLLLAALVVEQFEDVLERHVELSFFVPLIMGHGGNTGSQSVTTVIRALALKQITNRDIPRVVLKEAGAGCMMGAILGLAILGFSCVWSGISTQVGATVAIALPLVSAWANGLGALFTLLADRYRFDPAVTSVPLVTTIVDSTGLVLYFFVAKWMLGIDPS